MQFLMILTFVMSVAVTAVQAQTIGREDLNLDGLSQADRVKILQNIEDMKQKASSPEVKVEQVEMYADIGKKYGSAIASTAKELGVAVNEFVDTPAGFITAALIIWNIAGNDILGVVGGTAWFTVMMPLWVWLWVTQVHRPAWITTTEKISDKTITRKERNMGSRLEADIDAMRITLFGVLFCIAIAGFIMVFS